MRVISRSEVRQAITIGEAIDAARTTFVALASGQGVVPLRAHLATANGLSLFMPAYDPSLATVGVKVATVTPGNPERGLPTVQAIVILIEERTGSPLALLDGTFLTQLRTGAAIGVAADLFARPGADTIALFGAGATAQTSLWAVCAVRPIREVRVVHPHAERFPAFQAAMRDYLGDRCPTIQRVESQLEAIADAPIVVTATTSAVPLFPGEALASGAFVGALGAYTPRTRELDQTTIVRARVVVDTREGALHEAGDLIMPIEAGAITPEHIHAELGEILLGTRPGRASPDQIVVFKSVGNAMQDLALAAHVYERAQAIGLGTEVAM